MRQVVTYSLHDGAYQPYERCLELGLGFEGGTQVGENNYIGFIDGDSQVIQELLLNNEFNLLAISNDKAIELYSSIAKDYNLFGEVITKQQQIDDFISKLT